MRCDAIASEVVCRVGEVCGWFAVVQDAVVSTMPKVCYYPRYGCRVAMNIREVDLESDRCGERQSGNQDDELIPQHLKYLRGAVCTLGCARDRRERPKRANQWLR